MKKTSGKSPKAVKKTVGFSGSAQTMEDLLKITHYQLRGLKTAEIIPGRVTEIRNKMVLVDVGAKSEGIVVGKEYEEAKDFIANLNIGDEVLVYVRQPEDDKGQIILSLRKAAADWQWGFFREKLESQEVIEVRGLSINKGGVIVRAKQLQGFVPSSQFSQKYHGSLDQFQNRLFKVRVIEVDQKKNRLIFSEKMIGEAKLLAEKRKVLEGIKKGDLLEGEVIGMKPFGAFVQIKKELIKEDKKEVITIEGLVHISEISWEKVEKIEDHFKVGDKVKVVVLEIVKESGRLNLSIKKLTPDPWQKIAEEFKVGKQFSGKVTRLVSFGAFVNIKPGVDALLHISKIPADYPIKAGDDIEVEVETLEPESRRMSLALVLKTKPVGYK